MSYLFIVLCIFVTGILGFFIGKFRAHSLESRGQKMHSRTSYYGWWVFILSAFPAWLFLLCWSFVTNVYLEHRALKEIGHYEQIQVQSLQKEASSSEQQQVETRDEPSVVKNRSLILSIVKALLQAPQLLHNQYQSYAQLRQAFGEKGLVVPLEAEAYMVSIADHWATSQLALKRLGLLLASIIAGLGFIFGLWQIKPRERARNKVESMVIFGLAFSSLIAVLTTAGIVLSLIFETFSFFHAVPLSNFFFGTVWDPRFAGAGADAQMGQFGFLPLLAGTLYIAFVAMLFAVPVGLFSAIYMAEYASKRSRAIIKPLLEVLAGIPTIVYGFFAVITVGPFLRDLSIMLVGGQGFIMAQSVLTAGLVMGILLIPFISSLADDILTAVPRALRDGSYGLGATQSETIKKVVLPAALPGVIGALLLAASRAIGETMIVVLAAGVAARLTLNPFESMTTITVKIVNQLTGDLEFNTPQTLVAFALGITLFVLTLLMNIYAVYIVRKYREQYE